MSNTTPTGYAPTSAKQASDWAAGPQAGAGSPPPADYNAQIASNATNYVKEHGATSHDQVDCSNFTAQVIGASDPNFDARQGKDYRDTRGLKQYLGAPPPADGMYEKVDPKDVKAGDLVLFSGENSHVGVVTKPVDSETGVGSYMGSQSSTGVASADFGPNSGYWGKAGGAEHIAGYVRYKGKAGAGAGSGTKAASANGGAGAGQGDSGKGKAKNKKPEAKKVTNNNKELAHKKSRHKGTTKTPTDVHKPVGNGSPAPFMNWQWTDKLVSGSVITYAENAMIWLKDTAMLIPSQVSHASHLPGIVSSTYQSWIKAISSSLDLTIEGQKAVREKDKTQQNAANTTGEVVKPPPPAAKAGAGDKKADDTKKCLKLGPNKEYKDAIQTASKRTGMPSETIASVIGAEAGVNKNGEWNPGSDNGIAVGLTQFTAPSWKGMATKPGSYLNEQAVAKGYVEKDAKGEGYHVVKGKESDLLAMRTDPDTSIITGAEYDTSMYNSLQAKGKIPQNQNADDAARALYTCHHEGEGGASRYWGDAQKSDNEHYEHLLAGQFGDTEGQSEKTRQAARDKAAEKVKAENGDAKAAYKKWFEDYMDKKITPKKFACTDDKVDGDDAPKKK
jgi:hypothetical protein